MDEMTITESELADALRILSITNYPERDARRIMRVLWDKVEADQRNAFQEVKRRVDERDEDAADIALGRLYGKWVWGAR